MYVEWDVMKITAANYTVEFKLNPQIYDNFLENYYDDQKQSTQINQFKKYIKDELEDRLTQMPHDYDANLID